MSVRRDLGARVDQPWGSQQAVRPPPQMTEEAKAAKVVWLQHHAERLREAKRTAGGGSRWVQA